MQLPLKHLHLAGIATAPAPANNQPGRFNRDHDTPLRAAVCQACLFVVDFTAAAGAEEVVLLLDLNLFFDVDICQPPVDGALRVHGGQYDHNEG